MGAKDRLRAAAVAGLLLTGFPSAFAQNWTLTSAPITNWTSVAMSADGSKIAAVSGSDVPQGLIYYSTNAGTTWAAADAPSQYWCSVATSADGTKWIAAGYYGSGYASNGIFLSTNGAANWNFARITDTNNFWSCVRSSATGETLAVADHGFSRPPRSLLFVSTNAGSTWSLSIENFTNMISSLATSADGHNWLLAGDWWAPTVLASSDRTLTWVETDAPEVPWSCLAISADGWKAVAAGYSGIYVSTNQGMNWTATSAPHSYWKGMASSANGTKLAAVMHDGFIYTTSNSGVSWIPANAPSANWTSVASSADGCKLAATIAGGGIYTLQNTPCPELTIAPFGNGLRISWIVPSMPFVLQETADLNAPDWTAVPMTPILNLTNLHHEVTVPLPGTKRFYRLQRL